MDLEDFIQGVELVDIIVHEERARKVVNNVGQKAEKLEPTIETSLGIRSEDLQLGIRFRMLFTGHVEEYVADYEAIFLLSEITTPNLNESILKDFAEQVGFMAVYPYLRMSIYGSASRLGMPKPVLGLARRGDFRASEKMSDSQAQEAFFDNLPESNIQLQNPNSNL